MTKKDAKKIGQRIRAARVELGLSQRELSRRNHLTAAYISRLEAGDRDPSMDALAGIGKALGTTGLILLTGNDNCICTFCGREKP